MPPAPIRRPLTVTTWLVLSLAYLGLSPLLLALAAVASRIARRPQPLLATYLLRAYFARELWSLVACGGLWLASGCGLWMRARRIQLAHHRLLRRLVHGMTLRARELMDIDVASEVSPEAQEALKDEKPLLFLSRHAGPGDTVLLIDRLYHHHRRLPSVVLKDILAVDPGLDLLGHRLPHALINGSDAERCERRIAEVASGLPPRGILVIFPEGGNFTPQRRRRALRSLRRKGQRREAAAGEAMTHVMPPHPGGTLAALRGNPDADVLFSAHTGLGLAAFPRELWREVPVGQTFRQRVWHVPAQDRPRDPQQQVKWLYEWWARLDRWVEQQGTEPPADQPPRAAV